MQKKPRKAEKNITSKQNIKLCKNLAGKEIQKVRATEECLQSLLTEFVNPMAGRFGRHHFTAYHSILCAIENLYSTFHPF